MNSWNWSYRACEPPVVVAEDQTPVLCNRRPHSDSSLLPLAHILKATSNGTDAVFQNPNSSLLLILISVCPQQEALCSLVLLPALFPFRLHQSNPPLCISSGLPSWAFAHGLASSEASKSVLRLQSHFISPSLAGIPRQVFTKDFPVSCALPFVIAVITAH